MILPIIPEDLFEINPSAQVFVKDEVLYVDNFYLNYDSILECLHNISVPNWKLTESSRNFKDYFDCRPIFLNHFSVSNKTKRRFEFINHLLVNYLKQELVEYEDCFEFNYFKHIKTGVPNSFQHNPHCDGDWINMIAYLDVHADGGTAIYEHADMHINTSGIEEEKNMLQDISDFKIMNIIEAKPNRCVFFDGSNLHGGFIRNHQTYEQNWRINQVSFLKTRKITGCYH